MNENIFVAGVVFVSESVELLAAVAQIDFDQTPPCCLEIAQLCGRRACGILCRMYLIGLHAVPLCLNIVGNLIRTFGDGWEVRKVFDQHILISFWF